MVRYLACLLWFVLCLFAVPPTQAASWDRLGPNGGRVVAIAPAPSDPHIVYAGGAFVYRSTDGGSHWTRTADTFPASGPDVGPPLVRAMAVSPKDPNRVIVASAQGLFVTKDGGVTWARAGGITSDIVCVAFSADGKGVRASAGDSMYRSTNSGDTWDVLSLPAMVALCADPRVGTALIGVRAQADGAGKLLYRSDDGNNWYPFSSFAVQGLSAIQSSPSGDAVYVSSPSTSGGIWRVTRVGDASNVYGLPVSQIALMRATLPCLLAAPASGSPVALRTCSDGAYWDTLSAGLTGRGVNSLAFGLDSTPLAGTDRAGVMAWNESGMWTASNAGLDMASLTSAVQSSDINHVLLSASGDGLYRSINNGDTWALCHLSTTRSIMAVSPASPGRVWHVGTAELEKSDDNGQTWQHFMTNLPAGADVVRVVPHPTQKNTVFIVLATGALYENTTSNPNWILRLAAWPSPPSAPADVVFSPADPSRMFCTRPDGLYRSTDTGAHWSFLTASLPAGAMLCCSPTDVNTVYRASTVGGTVFVSRSNDGGSSWNAVRQEASAANSGFAATFLAIDSRKPSRILLGTNRGLRISDDGGNTWRVESVGTAGVFATSWAPYGTTGDLLGTSGAGLLRCRPSDHSELCASDALKIMALAMSGNTPTADDLAFGDLNEDGQITVADADLALRSATGP